MTGASGPERGWTFLSNHGHVLVAIAKDPQARLRDVAQRVGITERAVQLIVRDLEQAGYVHKERVGRRNSYTLAPRMRFRHPLEHEVRIGDFVDLVTSAPPDLSPARRGAGSSAPGAAPATGPGR